MSQVDEELDYAPHPYAAEDAKEGDPESEGVALARMRHSTAHLMAGAVLKLFPDAKFGIGPAIEDGFYYDFDLPRPLTTEDLRAIEGLMAADQAAAYPYQYDAISRDEALTLFQDQPYKVELIENLPADATISTYQHGAFRDLCRGPHVVGTNEVGVYKLLSIAGAYWRGDEKRPMLQRIYGTAWNNAEDLAAHLHKLEEAERRDHRRLGKELDLFSIHEEAGAGLIYWHPKGGLMRVLIENYWRERHLADGYDIVFSPHIGRAWLWETSGHLGFYKESMYPPIEMDNQEFYVKPMNCPFHIMMYKTTRRSYRDLPMRFAELGTVYRYERSGALHGLLRVRGFTQDDAHLFCRPDQMHAEVLRVVDFSLDMLRTFGFHEYEIYLSTRPEKAVGEQSQWDDAQAALRAALEERELPYKVDEGGGAFYGPKIDVKIKDSLGRAWQCTTIQFDFNEPERFDMAFIGEDGKEHRPYMIHRALLGSIERFFGCLIEHYAGAFPLWITPVQAELIPISDVKHMEYAESVLAQLKAAGLRAEIDSSKERMGAKIRHAQMQKIPYMLVIGDKERDSQTVSVRLRSGDDLGAVSVADLIERMKQEVASKA
ncbi:MAG: threonine--tRNA ligase [Chloroflexota bacterium]|nr:threonine--tRNA ligase [Chloroflexota bacterium]